MLGLLALLVRQSRFSLHKEGRRGSRGYVLSVCSPICVVTGFESIRDCLLRSLLLLFVFSGIWKRGIIMSGCGNANCKCGAGCTCKDGCSCGMTMAVPSFGGLRNYNEPDCKCGPDCKCADCDCHKGK